MNGFSQVGRFRRMLNEVGVRENNREFKQLRMTTTTTTTSKNNLFYEQNNSSARASCFLYISLTSTARLRQDTSADATFYRGRGHTTTNSPFSFWTWILRFLIIQLQEKSPAFDILRGFKYTRLCLKERKFIFWGRFHCQSTSSLPKLPNVPMTGYADLLCLSHLLCSIDNKHSLLKDVITRVALQEHQRSWTDKLITIEKTVFYFFEVHCRSFYRLQITNCLTSSPG